MKLSDFGLCKPVDVDRLPSLREADRCCLAWALWGHSMGQPACSQIDMQQPLCCSRNWGI